MYLINGGDLTHKATLPSEIVQILISNASEHSLHGFICRKY